MKKVKRIEEFLRIAYSIEPYDDKTYPLLRVDRDNQIYVKIGKKDIFLHNRYKYLFLKQSEDRFDYHYDID